MDCQTGRSEAIFRLERFPVYTFEIEYRDSPGLQTPINDENHDLVHYSG